MTDIAYLPARAVLEVSGDDRVTFLQGLVSNDVALAAPGRAVWAALLTPQGKWLADFFIVADAGRLLLDVEAAQAAMLTQRLTRYRLRSDVAVQLTPLQVYAGWNGQAPDGAVLDPRLEQAGWRCLSTASLPTTADAEAWDIHRLRLGLPDGSRDLEAEKSTLLEAGFDELNGVSWTKGCYMGQELTARTKYRGLVKRRLIPVRIDGPSPSFGASVMNDGAEVGAMRSSRGGFGLALLRNDAVNAAALSCDAARLTPALPAWLHVSPARADAPA